jgi:hypothetical protein
MCDVLSILRRTKTTHCSRVEVEPSRKQLTRARFLAGVDMDKQLKMAFLLGFSRVGRVSRVSR